MDGAFFFGCPFIYLILHLAVIIIALSWVHNDAEERGRNGCLWTLVVLVFGLPGLVLWLVLRNEFDRSDSYTPVSNQPKPLSKSNQGPEIFSRTITNIYLQYKQRKISETQFQEQKAKAIEELRTNRFTGSAEEYLNRLVSFIESDVLTEHDVTKIQDNLTKGLATKEAEAIKPGAYGTFNQQQLIADYLRSPSDRLAAELAARKLPAEREELVIHLNTPRLIDLYRENKSLLYADELHRRGLGHLL